MGFVRVPIDEAPWPGQMLGVTLRRVPVMLANVDGHIVAFHDRCAHLGVRVSEGRLEAGTVTCRAHQWQYDGRTGAGIRPCGVALRALPVRVQGEEVYVDVSGASDD